MFDPETYKSYAMLMQFTPDMHVNHLDASTSKDMHYVAVPYTRDV